MSSDKTSEVDVTVPFDSSRMQVMRHRNLSRTLKTKVKRSTEKKEVTICAGKNTPIHATRLLHCYIHANLDVFNFKVAPEKTNNVCFDCRQL